MIARGPGRYLIAALTLVVLGSAALAGPRTLNLGTVAGVGQGEFQFVFAGHDKKAQLTVFIDPAYLGGFSDINKFDMDADVKSALSLSTDCCPFGVKVTIDSAKIVWKAEEGYRLKLVLKAERDDASFADGSGDYHFKGIITNSKANFETTLDMGVLLNG